MSGGYIPTAADPEIVDAAIRLRRGLSGGSSATTTTAMHDLKVGAARRERLLAAGNTGVPPVDLLLFCPSCGRQHIDAPEPGTSWANPPHRTHACAFCERHWRPADVATNGVAAIRSRGSKDNWEPADLVAPAIAGGCR